MMNDASQRQVESRKAETPRSPMEHRVMFVVFALLSFVMFAPVVMLPIIRDHGELLVEESRLLERNARLRTELNRRVVMLDAFQNDAVVNERLAMLDLHYRKPGEDVLTVLPKHFEAAEVEFAAAPPVFQSVLKIPSDWPEPARRAEAWAQQNGLIDLFLNPDVRPAFLLMSGGLLIAAFVLFAPRLPRKQPAASRVRVLPPRSVHVAPGRTV